MEELNCSYSIASSSSFYDESRLKCKFEQFLIKLQSAINNHKMNHTFFRSVSLGINRLCKYKNAFPNSVDELALNILDILVKARAKQSKICSIEQKSLYDHCIEEISKPLLHLLTLKLSNLQNKLAFLQSWIKLVSFLNDRSRIQTLLIQSDLIVKCLLDYIFQSGNYTVQLLTLQLLLEYLKYSDPSTQSKILDGIFDNELSVLCEILLDLKPNSQFEGHYRKFLNTFNLRLSVNCKVYSCSPIRAELGALTISNQNNFWINFNSETNSVSFFLSPKVLKITEHTNTNLIMCDYNIKRVKLCRSKFKVTIETTGKANIMPRYVCNFVELDLSEIHCEFSSSDFFSIQRSKSMEFIKVEQIPEPLKSNFFESTSDSDKENKKTTEKRSTEKQIDSNIQKSIFSAVRQDPRLIQNQISAGQHNKDIVAETASSDYTDDKKKHNELIIDGTSSCVSKEDKRNLKKIFKKKPTKDFFQEKGRVLQTQKSLSINIHSSDRIDSFKSPEKQIKMKKNESKIDLFENLKTNLDEPMKLIHTYPLRNRQLKKKNEESDHPSGSGTKEKKFSGTSISKISTNDSNPKPKPKPIPDRRLRVSSIDSQGLNSERLINLVRPLRIFGEEPNALLDNQDQIQLAVEEYSMNRGIVGVSAHLKEPSVKEKYTAEQLNNAQENIKKLNASFERSARKFFKNDESKENVYDLENSVKDCGKSKLLKSVQKRNAKTRTPVKSIKRLKKSNKKVGDKKNDKETEKAICVSTSKVLNEKSESAKEKTNLSEIQEEKDINEIQVVDMLNLQRQSKKIQEEKDVLNLQRESKIEEQNSSNLNKFDVLRVSSTCNVRTTKRKIKSESQVIDLDLTPNNATLNLKNSNEVPSKILTQKIHDLKAMLNQSGDKKNLSSQNFSNNNDQTIDTGNFPSHCGSQKIYVTPSLPSSYVIDLDVSETIIETPVVIKKDWLLQKFFNDVKIYAKIYEEIGSGEEENKNEVGNEKENETKGKEMEVGAQGNKMEVEEAEAEADSSEADSDMKISTLTKKNQVHETKGKEMEVGAHGNKMEVEEAEADSSEADSDMEMSTLTKKNQVHCRASTIDEKELKENNSNRTFVIEDDLSYCGQSSHTAKSNHKSDESSEEELNDIEIIKNISLDSSGGQKSIIIMPPISCSSISRNSNANNINKEQMFEKNKDALTSTANTDRTRIKRKFMENKTQLELELKKNKFCKVKCDETGETAEAQTNGNCITDFLNTYKEKLYAKSKEINEKYESKILANNMKKSQDDVDQYFRNIEDIEKSLEMNKLIIFDLKSKLKEKEEKHNQLIGKRDEYFEKIRDIFVEIDEFYETNKDNFEVHYKESKNELLQNSVAIRNELWQNHLDQIINTFVESLGRHYIFDNENSDLNNS